MKLRIIITFFILTLASRESIAATDSISVTVDTLCSSWHICVTDGRANGGIKSVILLNDTNGAIIQPPQISTNVKFDRSFDPLGERKVDYPLGTKNSCFDVLVDSIDKNANASLFIIDNNDQYHLIKLVFINFGYKYDNYNSIYWDFGVLDMTTNLPSSDAFKFPATLSKTFTLKRVFLKNNSGAFYIKHYYPEDLATISPGSNVIVNFGVHPQDTGIFYDTLVCETDCFSLQRPLIVTGGCGIIYAHDADVGYAPIGGESESFLKIENKGYMPLTIFNGLFYSNGEVIVEPFSAPSITLPISIEPNSVYWARSIFKPIKLGIDSAIIVFKTGSPDPFKHSIKDTMWVRGRGVLPKLMWNTSEGRMLADSISPQILNLTLTNHEKFSIDIKRFYISGEDSAEFSIINSLIPLQNVTITSEESDWFTIGFLPDMNKPISKRYENRHATLNIETEHYTITLPLVAGFGLNNVKHELALKDISFSPNPIYGQDATLFFTIAEPKQLSISIFDILGREVITLPSQYYSGGSYSNTVGTSKLGDGSYILKVSDGSFAKSLSFRVVR